MCVYQSMQVVILIGETVLVHGGIRRTHLDFGLENLNAVTRRWLLDETSPKPFVLGNVREAAIVLLQPPRPFPLLFGVPTKSLILQPRHLSRLSSLPFFLSTPPSLFLPSSLSLSDPPKLPHLLSHTCLDPSSPSSNHVFSPPLPLCACLRVSLPLPLSTLPAPKLSYSIDIQPTCRPGMRLEIRGVTSVDAVHRRSKRKQNQHLCLLTGGVASVDAVLWRAKSERGCYGGVV